MPHANWPCGFLNKTSCVTDILVLLQTKKMSGLSPPEGIGLRCAESLLSLQGRFSLIAGRKRIAERMK